MDMMELIRQEMPRLHLLEQLLPQQPLHPLFGPPTYDLFVAGLSCEDFPLFRWSLMTFHDATRVDYARTLSRHGFLVNATVKFPTKELAQAALHEFPFEAFGEAVYAARDPRCMQWTDEELVRELDCARLTYVLIDNIAPGFPRTLARQVRELGGVPFGFVDIDDDFIFTGLAAFPTPQAAHAAVREFDGHPFAGRAMVARAEGARALAEAARILHDEHVARRQQQHGAPWDPQREIERVRLQDPARTFNIRVRILREHGRTLMHWVHFFNGRVFRRVREPFTVYVSFASRAAADGAMAVLNAMRAHDGSRRFAAARDLQHGACGCSGLLRAWDCAVKKSTSAHNNITTAHQACLLEDRNVNGGCTKHCDQKMAMMATLGCATVNKGIITSKTKSMRVMACLLEDHHVNGCNPKHCDQKMAMTATLGCTVASTSKRCLRKDRGISSRCTKRCNKMAMTATLGCAAANKGVITSKTKSTRVMACFRCTKHCDQRIAMMFKTQRRLLKDRGINGRCTKHCDQRMAMTATLGCAAANKGVITSKTTTSTSYTLTFLLLCGYVQPSQQSARTVTCLSCQPTRSSYNQRQPQQPLQHSGAVPLYHNKPYARVLAKATRYYPNPLHQQPSHARGSCPLFAFVAVDDNLTLSAFF
ncbi:hypothetical protein PTSG_02669 [Salpingoeca rosetta]|uniref:RRM domain-containing protein n=1 Tax=Salpingoeca rosetta (strain ATCC 50818 / BSB-021) TaxID=946362 RepID=F2U2Y9_SALR5|nr:uncharacterized protein PTSG_02669 [Salpingoeca rosetta]EGD81983.1 hypothetical protein PTSG_02669 [Salpingoeca rosetta]|eukprot:XP_004996166.1 hypothetical protein PTSG_02669 [Salpingoeca rosetta]